MKLDNAFPRYCRRSIRRFAAITQLVLVVERDLVWRATIFRTVLRYCILSHWRYPSALVMPTLLLCARCCAVFLVLTEFDSCSELCKFM